MFDPSKVLREAISLHQRGDLSAAEKMYRQILLAEPEHSEALHLLGVLSAQSARFSEAISTIQRAIQLSPGRSVYFLNLGVALDGAGQLQDAEAAYRSAISLNPDYFKARYNLGVTLQKLNRPEEALFEFDKVLALSPDDPACWNDRGIALFSLDRIDEAVDSYRRAISLDPQFVDAYVNLGGAFQTLGIPKAAIDVFDLALMHRPEDPDANWNKSLALLLDGQYREGWDLYEWRWKARKTGLVMPSFPAPRWDGTEDMRTKTLLVWAEQGLGDTIQFSRYIPLLRARGIELLFCFHPSLRSLLSGFHKYCQGFVFGEKLPHFDRHIPLLGLPKIFGTTLENIPYPEGYLSPEVKKYSSVSQRLQSSSRPLIGLVWRGSPNHSNDKRRSIPLPLLVSKLPTGVTYVVLQKELSSFEKDMLLTRKDVLIFDHFLEDFSDTAALCASCDLVLSVDTSVAHLCGALGVPVVVLLAKGPDFRWGVASATTPWYSSASLLRQTSLSDWASVVDQLNQVVISRCNQTSISK